ncbi:hypothetical protein BpHYR1_048522 [Brachionus plicatilis]|uniref:Uncharacterized protein n=1 Tax=Brachionus plicatilis TaxID=10195 RepID=A0A3M7Q6W1_BRAPC|nr:hypothetical protein BpHYR1_048522 [Brachionus plicatilis]
MTSNLDINMGFIFGKYSKFRVFSGVVKDNCCSRNLKRQRELLLSLGHNIGAVTSGLGIYFA